MARRTRKKTERIKRFVPIAPSAVIESTAKPHRISKKLVFEIEITVAVAIVAVIVYFLLFSFIYPQKIQAIKTEIVKPSLVEEKIPEKIPAPIKPDYEQEYMQNSKFMDMQHNFGQFETKLIRIGFFKGQFRADIWVKNVGKETAEFYVEKAFMQKGKDKYAYAGGNFTGKQFLINEERRGYVLYSDVPKDIKGSVAIVIGNSLGYSTVFGITTSSPHIYILEI